MTFWDRLAWAGSWAAPVAGAAALALFGLAVAWPSVSTLLGRGREMAWVIGLLSLAAAAAHLVVALHGAHTHHLTAEEKTDLSRRFWRCIRNALGRARVGVLQRFPAGDKSG